MAHVPDSAVGAATVLQIFRRWVAETPQAIALEAEGLELSYRELNRRADRLAARLAELGIPLEAPVGIVLRRSAAQIASVLAVVKAGAAYLPMDPDHPTERLTGMLEESGAQVLLTHRDLAGVFESSVETLVFPEEALEDARPSPPIPEPLLSPDSLLYLIFTSGSTGRPKGVAVPHRGVLALTQDAKICDLSPGSRMGQISNASFDISGWELWGSLLRGATLVVIPSRDVRVPTVLAQRLREKSISHLILSASLFNEVERSSPEAFAHVQQVLCGGEPLVPATIRRVLERGAPAQLANAYGPTESSVVSAWNPVSRVPPEAASIPIGTALEGEELLIVDADLAPRRIGEIGEILIGGDGLARGYYRRPRETAQAFIPHPSPRLAGERVYRSGDLARWTAEGLVDFVGRKDHQIKLRGHRIELGEIEARLAEHPALNRCVVEPRGAGQEMRLVAYFRSVAEAPSIRQLRSFLASTLPETMIPTVFVEVEAWPLNRHGKLDRAVLPEPGSLRPELEAPRVPPASATERRLERLWSRMLGIADLGIDDSLFELGGHSLLVTRMLSQVRELFGVEAPLDRFFREPTIRGLGAWIDAEPPPEGADEVALGPAPGFAGSPIPLSFSQQRVWFLLQLQPGNLAYQAQCYFRFRGALVPRALRQSLQDLVDRHEIFRTSFVSEEGRPVQVIHPPPRVPLPLVDLSGLPETDRETCGHRVMERILKVLIDPAGKSLVTWVLLRIAVAEHWLLHIEHHLIHDGWSFNILLEELAESYRCRSQGREPVAAEAPLRFADFAAWQHRWVDSVACRRQIDYWTEKLGDHPEALALPFDHPRPTHQTFRGSTLRWQMPPTLARSVRSLSRRRKTTVFVCLESAFAAVLSRYSGQTDVLVGSGIANRRWLAVERLVGMLVNNVVLRNDLSENPTFAEILRRAHRTSQEAFSNQDVPFDRVVKALRPDRGSRQNPLFQAFFSFHDAPLASVDFGEPAVDWVLGLSNGSAKFDLNVTVILPEEQRLGQGGRSSGGPRDEGITFLWELNRDLFDRSTVQRMIGHFERLVTQVSTDENLALDTLDLLTVSERQQLVVENNATIERFSLPFCLDELVRAQIERTPQATALVDETESLSYAALGERVGKVAHGLRELGVGPEIPVAVAMERSADLVVGLLGILEAGGGYVPLEPSYPRSRLGVLLEDLRRLTPASPPLLLAHGATRETLRPLDASGTCRLVCLEDLARTIPLARPQTTGPPMPADRLAYIIYTSGSTGRPKGVMNSHRAVAHRIFWEMRQIELGAKDQVLQKTPFSFDVSVWEFFWPLSVGASLILAKPGGHKEPAYLVELIASAGITTLHFVPSMLRAFLEAPGVGEACAGVRRVIASGEALDPDLVTTFKESLAADLFNHYGPTEAAVDVTTWLCDPVRDHRTVPIGRPTDNTQLYVLDRWGAPAALGIPGELSIGGVQVARGYLGDPRRTAQSFVPDASSVPAAVGGRLYRTGDRARWRRDGALDFLGRRDHQVKVRGFRIELGEIETVLAQHPAVHECVVLPLGGGDRLVAGIVVEEGATPDLRSFLAERLPEYMVPGTFQLLDSMPRTSSGKIDRRALNDLQVPTVGREQAAYVAPRTDTEELLVQIWMELVGSRQIGVKDNFFDLGGHSLHATRHMYRIQELLAITLPVRALYDAPTLETMAQLIEDRILEDLAQMSPDDAALPRACETR